MRNTTVLRTTIFLSFLVSFVLTILPLPIWAKPFRPEWVSLVLIYWTMTAPNIVGVIIGWSVGLLIDVLKGSVLGQHALGFAIMAYISLWLHPRFRVYPIAQQALVAGAILLPYLSLSLWINGIRGLAPNTWLYWAPLFSSILICPLIFSLLHAARQRAQRKR